MLMHYLGVDAISGVDALFWVLMYNALFVCDSNIQVLTHQTLMQCLDVDTMVGYESIFGF